MEKKRENTGIVKRLEVCCTLNHDIDVQIRRYETFCQRMTSIGGNNLSGMPRNPSPDFDKIGIMVAKKEEMLENIKRCIAKRDKEQKELQGYIDRLENPNEKAVVEMKYFDCMKWKTKRNGKDAKIGIAETLFGEEFDYEEREDAYLRRVYKLHETALSKLAEIYAAV